MRRCEYCGETFETEATELEHLGERHGNELGSIDRRRVAALDSDAGNTNPVVYAGAIGVLALVAVAAYFSFFAGGFGGDGGDTAAGSAVAKTPHDNDAVHYHGDIEVQIDGQRLDFSRQEYQLRDDHFHFEAGVGDRWHVHSRDVTLGYALGTLGIEVTDDSVTFEGTTYRADDPDSTVVVEVNGEDVNPRSYVLQEGDAIRIVARNDGSS